MNYKNYSDLNVDISEEIYKVPSNSELIIGIPRSGMVPAYMIAAHLNLPVVTLNEFLSGHRGSVGTRPIRVDLDNIKNILVVDDSVNTGNATKEAKKDLASFTDNFDFTFCAIYSATKETQFVDFYFKHISQPRVFQWNYKNHILNTRSCYDIDGVLCHDPSDDQNDDGERYIDFILNAPPLFIPSRYIPCLVTSRLEKYRKETEDWLNKHDIKWGELIMLNLASAEERRKLRIHGKFKGEVFSNREEAFFIESNWKQAKEIFRIAQKPVFCTHNDVLIQNESDITYFDNALKHSNSWNSHITSDMKELINKHEDLKEINITKDEKLKHLEWRINEVENNKWYRFSDYSFKYKVLFIMGGVTRKLGIHKVLAPIKGKFVKEIK